MRPKNAFLPWSIFILLVSVPPAAAQTKYYEDLKVLCREKSSIECCMASVAAMESGEFRQASKKETENYGCPEGFKRNSMRCMDSLQWCQPQPANDNIPSVEAKATPEHIKVFLEDRIERELEAMGESSPDYQALQKAWRPLLKEEEKKLKRLQQLVEQTSQDNLPKVIVTIFLEEDITERGQFPEVDPYLIIMGEEVVPLLMGSYDAVPTDMKEHILRVLTAIGSPHALSTARKALTSGNVREVMAGQAALRIILGDEAAPELIGILKKANNKEVVKSSLRQLEMLGAVDWCSHFLDAWQAGQVGFSDLFDIGDPQECSSRSLGEHVALLLKVLKSEGQAGEHYWIRELVARIDQPDAVYDLLPLWPQLVLERFRSGGLVKGYSGEAQINNVELGFTDAQADVLLKNMASILDVDELHEMAAVPRPLVHGLYLEDLLAKKKGKRLDLQGQVFSFRIEAIDGARNILASGEYRIRIGDEENITLTSSTGGFSDHQIALKVRFDGDKFMFHFEPLVIQLLPHAAQFSADVPVEGVYETDLLVSMRGERVPVTWRFTHLK